MPRKKGRLTKAQLAGEPDAQLRDNAKEVLEKFWSRVKTKLDAGDGKTMEMVSRMFQYDKGPGGVTIFNQHNQQINNGALPEQVSRVRSFDQIIGKLEEQENLARQNRLIAAPVENSDADEDDYAEDTDEETEIVDAELVGTE